LTDILRKMARQWRTSSKSRAAKGGYVIGEIPSIDETHEHLKTLPWKCCYCGKPLGATKQNKPNLDHRRPICRGGDARLSNLGLTCWPCNGSKGPLLEVEFKELLATVKTWPDKGKSLLIRLRGGYWTYRDVPKMLAEHQPRPAVWLTDKESAQLIKDTESTV
jgi:5-methylcytosine-specific restriction endonuclease McrA